MPDVAAEYVVNSVNTSGRTFHDAVGYLFLLDTSSGDFLRLSYKVGIVDLGGKLHIEWPLQSNTKIGSKWVRDMLTQSNARNSAFYGYKPNIIAFLSTSEGVFEINSSKVAYYFPLPDGTFEKTTKTLLEGNGRAGFDKFKVLLPGNH